MGVRTQEEGRRGGRGRKVRGEERGEGERRWERRGGRRGAGGGKQEGGGGGGGGGRFPPPITSLVGYCIQICLIPKYLY